MLAAVAMSAFALSAILLLFVYKLDKCSLGYEFCISVFTGCAFAFPSGTLLIIHEHRLIRTKRDNYLSDIYLVLVSLRKQLREQKYSLVGSSSYRRELINLHRQLSNLFLDVIGLKRGDVRKLLVKIFDLCEEVRKLNGLYISVRKLNGLYISRTKKSKFKDEIDDTIQLIDDCIKYIEDLQ